MPSKRTELDQSGLTLRTFHRSLPIEAAPSHLIAREFVMARPAVKRCRAGLRRHHAGHNGIMRALDARHIHKASLTANKRAARQKQLGTDWKPPWVIARAP